MNKPMLHILATVSLMIATTIAGRAETKEVSASFLRAAVSSIDNRSDITVAADYPGVAALQDVIGWYRRNDGYSRFSVKDPQSKVVFDAMYVRQGSSVFNQLLLIDKPHHFRFRGYKDFGENREDAIFVTSAEDLGPVVRPPATVTTSVAPTVGQVGAGATASGPNLRVTITDNTTSNRTVITNMEMNHTYTVNGMTVIVESEP